jgi:hypothetical protein
VALAKAGDDGPTPYRWVGGSGGGVEKLMVQICSHIRVCHGCVASATHWLSEVISMIRGTLNG